MDFLRTVNGLAFIIIFVPMLLTLLSFLLVCSLPLQDTVKVLNPDFETRLDHIYRHSVKTVTVAELKKMDKKGVFILDTREEDEFDVSHLKFARHVGYIWFDMRSVYNIPKRSTIIVYCAVGNRAERIGEKLLKAGYKHVYNLYGGIFEWINRGNPVYTSDMVQTSEIHGYNRHWGNWLTRGAKVF